MSVSETLPSHTNAAAYSEDKMEPSATAAAAGDTILGRKLKKILESDLETDSETAHALEELSTFFTDNTLHTRRFLRGEIERRSLQGCWWIPINSLSHCSRISINFYRVGQIKVCPNSKQGSLSINARCTHPAGGRRVVQESSLVTLTQ